MSLIDQLITELDSDPAAAERLHAALAAAVDPDRRFTATEMAERWGANPRTVERWCRDGRIPSAAKVGHRWLMPADAQVLPAQRRDLGEARRNGRRAAPQLDDSVRAALDALRPTKRRAA